MNFIIQVRRLSSRINYEAKAKEVHLISFRKSLCLSKFMHQYRYKTISRNIDNRAAHIQGAIDS